MTDQTFARLLLQRAASAGDAHAIRQKSRGIWRASTFGALADEAGHIALALSERGVPRGARIAVVGDNRPGLFAAIAATHALGAVSVPLYPDAEPEELAQQINAAEVSVVFAEDQQQVDKVLALLPRCPSVRLVIYDDDRGLRDYAHPGLTDHGTLRAEGAAIAGAQPDALRRAVEEGRGDETAFLFFTAGASGPAKGVLFTHAALIGRTRAATAAQGLGPGDVTFAFFPPGWLCQTMFSYMSMTVAGITVACPESLDTLIEDMRETAPTSILTTPRMIDAIFSRISIRMEETGGLNLRLFRAALEHARRVGRARSEGRAPSTGDRLRSALHGALIYAPLRDILGMSRLKSALCTGDTLDPAMLGFFQALGIDLRQLYGSTETAFFVAMHRPGAARPDTVGTPLDDVEVRIAEDGEILVKGAGMMQGYLGGPSDAAAPNGWLRTGDLGSLGPDGQLRVTDRLDATGRLADGTTFAPRPLESRIRVSPHVREAVVIGDGADSLCALIDIDTMAVGRWADGHGVAYMGHLDLAGQDGVYGLIGAWLAEVNGALAREPETAGLQIRRFALVPEELSTANGLLTPTGKVRRHAVVERFAPIIAALQEGHAEAMLESAEDDEGHRGPVALKIREVQVLGSVTRRRAA